MEERSTTRQHNLPSARTSFVGREKEVEEIRRALATTRLLTLTGAGGSGKTRLALEVARDLANAGAGAYPDGVWIVELASLSEARIAVGSTDLWVSHELVAGSRPNQFLLAPPAKSVVVSLW